MLSILNFRKPAPPQHTVDPSNFALTTVFKSSWNNYIFQRVYENNSLRKQPTFGDATTDFPAKWRLRNERINSTLMMRHYSQDLGSASDWSYRVGNLIQPIRSTIQISVVTRLRSFPRRHLAGKPAVMKTITYANFGGAHYGGFEHSQSRHLKVWSLA